MYNQIEDIIKLDSITEKVKPEKTKSSNKTTKQKKKTREDYYTKASVFKGKTPFQIKAEDLENNLEYVLERSVNTVSRTERIIKITMGVRELKSKQKRIITDIYDTSDFDDLFSDEDILDTTDTFFDDITSEIDIIDPEQEIYFEEDDNRSPTDITNDNSNTDYKYDCKVGDYTILYDCKFTYKKMINPNELKIKGNAKVDLTKEVVGDAKHIEDLTIILNLISNFNIEDSIETFSDYIFVNDISIFKKVYNCEQSTLTQFFVKDDKLAKEVFNGLRYNISISRFTPNKSKPLYPTDKLCFKGINLDLHYYKTDLKGATKSELDVAEKIFNNRTIYLPKPSIYTEIYGLNLHYINSSDYEIIDTETKLRDAIEDCKKTLGDTGVVCYDAETTGLRFRRFIKDRDELCTHSLSWRDGQSIIVPVRMKNEQNIPPHIANEYLKTVLEVNPILAHNGSADTRFLLYDNINLNLKEDTMHLIKHILPFITQYAETGFARYLDDLVKQAFGYDMIDMMKYVFKPSNATFDFSVVNRDYMKWYGCPDTDLCRRLWKILRPKLHPQQVVPYIKTVEFSKALALSSAYSGMGINIDAIKKEKDRAIALTEKLQEIIYKITGEDRYTLSLTSSTQKTNYIFGKMGAPIEYARRTENNSLSADKFVMNKLANIETDTPTGIFKADILDIDGENVLLKADNLNKLKYPVTKLMREFDDLNSNIKAHYNRLEKLSEDYVYYPDFSPGKTDTWRTIDGVQTMKNSLKKEIGPVSNDVSNSNNEVWYWSTTDYRTQEVCLAANQSEDWTMIDMLSDVEADSHTMTASELWGKPPYLVTKDERGGAKTCNFGIIYGMKHYTLGQRVYNKDKLTPEEEMASKSLYELYTYKKAEMLKPLAFAKAFVTENGYLVNKLGYKMIYPKVIDKESFIKDVFDTNKLNFNFKPKIDHKKKAENLGRLLNASGNYPIQSWAAGILMDVYCKFLDKIKEDGYENDIFVPLTVHDEIGLCFRTDKVHPYYIIHAELETLVCHLEYLNKEKVAPLYIGIGFGPNWKKAKDDPAEIPIKLQYIMQQEYLNGTAPTREEILEEGIYEHFRRRICDYIRQRCIDLFPEMYESKHWYRLKVQDTLNKYEMYVGKQMNENFRTYLPKSTDIDMEVFLRAIYNRKSHEPIDDIIYEDGEPIEDEFVSNEGEITEFFFIDGEIHERITVGNDYLRINLSRLNASVVNNVKEYINTLKTDIYNIHNKKIIYIESNGHINRTEDEILGIPINFTDIFNCILDGNKVNFNLPPELFRLESSVYVRDNSLIITQDYMDEVKEKARLGALTDLLTEVTSKAFIAKIPIIVRNEKTGEQKDTGFKVVSINENLLERFKEVIR